MEYSSTSERARTNKAADGRGLARGLPLSLPLLALLVALLPRTIGLGDFFTTDEAYHWITRTERFAAAVGAGRWADTILTGHPGVTLMWLGSLGLRLEQAAGALGLAAPTDQLGHLAWLRLGPALVHGGAIGLGYLLLRRLLRPPTALAAALLWATSPYLVAHGRLLHLDALLTDFCTLTLLAALAAVSTPRPLPWLALSGLCAGLALLTKGPALIILPCVGLLLFALHARGRSTQDAGGRTAGRRRTDQDQMGSAVARDAGFFRRLASFGARGLAWALPRYLLWLGVALLTVVALWPALWAAPGAAIERYVGEIVGNGGRPNGDGQFFLGRNEADPGPLFYPLAAAFRLTPLELFGLLALAMLPLLRLVRHVRGGLGAERRMEERSDGIGQGGEEADLEGAARSSERVTLLALLAFVLFWTLVMTLGPKKFDRYTLPTWPALLTLSAAGLSALFEWVARKLPALSERALGQPAGTRSGVRTNNGRRRTTPDSSFVVRPASAQPTPDFRNSGLIYLLPFGLSLPLLLFQALTLAWYHPYYLSYYSPLLGGGAAAQRALLIGWGEGMDQVGAWLRARPDIGQGQILAALPPTLQPFVPVPVQEVRAIDSVPANYAVVYLESLQRGDAPAIYARIAATQPLHRVTIHGIEYARIHQLPKPYQVPSGAEFGGWLGLRGYTATREGGRLIITPAWDVRGPPGGDYSLFLHLYNAAGEKITQIDLAPGGASAPPTGQWRPGEQFAVPLPLDLPPGLPPGSYTLALGLYDPISFARLPLSAGPAYDPARAGPDAALLGTLQLDE